MMKHIKETKYIINGGKRFVAGVLTAGMLLSPIACAQPTGQEKPTPVTPGGSDDAEALRKARDAAIVKLQNYVKGKDANYYTTEWDAIQKLINDGTAAINVAGLAEINDVLTAYEFKIDGVKTKTQIDQTTLVELQAAAIKDLTEYTNRLDPAKYDQANWNTIQNLKERGTAALGSATAANIPTVLSSYKSQIDNVKTKEQQQTPIPNIEFKSVEDVWGGNPSTEIRSALNQLAEQNRILLHNNLVGYLHLVRTDIAATLEHGTNIIRIKDEIDPRGLISKMASSMNDNNAAMSFIAQANAFRQAHVLNQREYCGYQNGSNINPNEKSTRESALLAQVKDLGINATTIPQAITQLKAALKSAALPAEVKQYMDGILQQWEDFAQFDGWTQDISALGYGLTNIPRTQQPRAAVQTRTSMQENAGLHL